MTLPSSSHDSYAFMICTTEFKGVHFAIVAPRCKFNYGHGAPVHPRSAAYDRVYCYINLKIESNSNMTASNLRGHFAIGAPLGDSRGHGAQVPPSPFCHL